MVREPWVVRVELVMFSLSDMAWSEYGNVAGGADHCGIRVVRMPVHRDD